LPTVAQPPRMLGRIRVASLIVSLRGCCQDNVRTIVWFVVNVGYG
jgi:hypothetical protein